MSSAASSCVLTPRAYLKLVLHAAKYSSRSVCGLLVSSEAAASSPTLVTDVVPLFHTCPLAPALELALSHAEAALPASHSLVGVYYAPELYEPRIANGQHVLPTPQANTAIKIAEKIKENGKGQARILLLDNVRLGSLGSPASASTHSALEVFEQSGKQHSWTLLGAATIASASRSSDSESAVEFVVSQLRALIKEDKQRFLSDFDDHLDDAQADWTNVEFEKTHLPTGTK